MRLALEVFEETGDQQALDRAVAAALEAVQILRQLDSVHCPDAGEVSWLTFVLPDLRDLARVLVSQAEDAAQTYLDSLWRTLALGTAPPAWGEAERTTAQTLVVFRPVLPGGQRSQHSVSQLAPDVGRAMGGSARERVRSGRGASLAACAWRALRLRASPLRARRQIPSPEPPTQRTAARRERAGPRAPRPPVRVGSLGRRSRRARHRLRGGRRPSPHGVRVRLKEPPGRQAGLAQRSFRERD